LTKEDLSNLRTLGEGFTTEFKRAGTSNVGRAICAFANATGGVILIGVTDAGEVVGVGNHNRLKSEVKSTARSAEPPIAIDVQSIGDELSPVPCSVVSPKRTSWTVRNSRATFTPSMKIVWPICNPNSIPL